MGVIADGYAVDNWSLCSHQYVHRYFFAREAAKASTCVAPIQTCPPQQLYVRPTDFLSSVIPSKNSAEPTECENVNGPLLTIMLSAGVYPSTHAITHSIDAASSANGFSIAVQPVTSSPNNNISLILAANAPTIGGSSKYYAVQLTGSFAGTPECSAFTDTITIHVILRCYGKSSLSIRTSFVLHRFNGHNVLLDRSTFWNWMEMINNCQ